MHKMSTIYTIGHGRRSADELVAVLLEAGALTVVDIRRYPGSRRNPQFDQLALAETLDSAGIGYLHAVELGGMLSGEPGEERFPCVREPAFRSYLARMGSERWQLALADALELPAPAFMCAETPWRRCHRRFVAELLTVREHDVVHLVRPGECELHRPSADAEDRDGKLYVCGSEVA